MDYAWLIDDIRTLDTYTVDEYTKRVLRHTADAIEELSKPRWIPVTERLPSEELAFYLCYTDAGIVVECLWTNNKYGLGTFGNWGWRLMDVPQYQKVTHWMPLPTPPKEETE